MREQIKLSATFLLSIFVALSISETSTYVKPILFLLSIIITLKHEESLVSIFDKIVERVKIIAKKTNDIKKSWSNSN